MKENIDKTNNTNIYQDMSDDELIKIAQKGNKKAEETLIERYQMLVYFKAKSYFLVGGDKEDIIQEGMIGLYKAIRDYEIDRESSFRSFAGLCVIRQIISAIKSANRKKCQPLNSSISLNKPIYNEESERTLLDVFQDKELNNPEELFISEEKFELIRSEIQNMSTELEFNVIQEYLKGKSYKEIADALDIHAKSVDNALQRFKKKLERFLERENISV